MKIPAKAPILLALFLFVCASPIVLASDPPAPKALRVGVFLEPPFAMNTAVGLTGFAVDLWSKIATTLGWTCNYQQISSIPELLDKLNKGQLDVGVTDLSITSERLQLVDFTHPYLDAGLQVMINEKHRGGFVELIRGLSEAGHLHVCEAALFALSARSFSPFTIDDSIPPFIARGPWACLSPSTTLSTGDGRQGRPQADRLRSGRQPAGCPMADRWSDCRRLRHLEHHQRNDSQ